MQRAAAIIGPTPAFLQWAIKRPCGLREIDTERLPESTFRQLRSIRELDLARRENRIFREVAFHPETNCDHELLGFLPAEILAASGGESSIQNVCSQCVANTQIDEGGWVGCFGVARLESLDMAYEFDAAVQRLELAGEFETEFVLTQPWWFGVWINSKIRGRGLSLLLQVFETLKWSFEWEQFRKALVACQDNDLELHAEYFPSGTSDGHHWKWDVHCDRCRSTVISTTSTCECCGRRRIQQAARKRKVLGLRPYMKLKYVLGEQKCEQLVSDYLDWKMNRISDQG